ncbi:MAG: helix-turn-helix domain-containing protein [Bacteroidales bacterium]|nr:helix-turn-helix domain-containing protein [Bacteroidales bacterium]MDD4669460.1 helix-turn-helix domain-containing protein [Bacteroidales bacterium]
MNQKISEILSLESFENRTSNDKTFYKCLTIDECNSYLFDTSISPKIISGEGLCVCTCGSCEIMIDQRSYVLNKGDMCCVFHDSIFRGIRISDDFSGYTIATDMTFLQSLFANFPAPTSLFLFIKDNPCISISEEDQHTIISLGEIIKEKEKRTEHPYRREIAKSFLTALSFEIAAMYQRSTPVQKQKKSRKELIFHKFIELVTKNYIKEKTVEYYAAQLCITPRYLSSMIKSATGMKASSWIARIIIINAKVLINTTDMTIQQISDYLNFANPSFFGQFFKRQTGQTPKEYRNSTT